MIPKDCKRLAEVDFPIAEVSKHSAREWPAAQQAQAGATEPNLNEPIEDPARFPWHEVTQVAHDYLSVEALTKPMRVREEPPPDGWPNA